MFLSNRRFAGPLFESSIGRPHFARFDAERSLSDALDCPDDGLSASCDRKAFARGITRASQGRNKGVRKGVRKGRRGRRNGWEAGFKLLDSLIVVTRLRSVQAPSAQKRRARVAAKTNGARGISRKCIAIPNPGRERRWRGPLGRRSPRFVEASLESRAASAYLSTVQSALTGLAERDPNVHRN